MKKHVYTKYGMTLCCVCVPIDVPFEKKFCSGCSLMAKQILHGNDKAWKKIKKRVEKRS